MQETIVEVFNMMMASIFAGTSVFCLVIFVSDFVRQLEIDKNESSRQLPVLFKVLIPFSPNVMFIAENPFLDNYRKHVREMIMMAGLDQIIDENRLIAVNVMTVMLGVIAFACIAILGKLLVGVILAVMLAAYPSIWLSASVKKRHLEIQKALPNVLDLLTLSVEAGKDFITSLRDILARRRKDALTEELERSFREIQLGKQRRIALKELAQRVQQPDLTTVLNSIIQADELGVSIGQILRIQGDLLRMKRFGRAEKLANEAPVKILFPLAVFILPAVIIILLGPVLMKGFNILLK